MKRTVMALLCSVAIAAAADNMKVFPPADDGMARHVLQLPPQADEAAKDNTDWHDDVALSTGYIGPGGRAGD